MNTATKPATYTESFKIMTYDADFKRRLKPKALLGYMQEVATNHAELLGLGYQASWENGFFWVLGRLRYDLYRTPVLGESLEVTTWPAGVDGVCALRRFEFRIGDEVVGIGLNYWLMLDTKRLRPIRPAYFAEMTKNLEIKAEDSFKIGKVPLPKDLAFTYERRMSATDLDWNKHVNNVRYAGLIYDSIPIAVLRENDIMALQINYLKEIRYGALVTVSACEDDNGWHTLGSVDGKKMFTANVRLAGGSGNEAN